MRICHVVEAAGGGSGQVVIDLIRSGVARGDDITLIFAPERADWRFLADVDQLAGSITVLRVNMSRDVGAHDARSLWHLYQVLRAGEPFAVIHSHSSKAGALARIAGLGVKDAAQVYTPHGFMTLDPAAPRWYGRVESRLAGLADAILVGSHYELRHALTDLGLAPERLHLVPNAIRRDTIADRDSARAALGASPGEFVLGFIGRLVSIKNPRRLAETFIEVAAVRPNVTLAVVGEGEDDTVLLDLLESAGLMHRVRMLGGVRGIDVVAGFDTLLCTSDSESFGLVLLEAMAVGVPVVSTPVGISEDILTNGVTGFRSTFQPADLAASVAAIAALPADRRRAMGRAARQAVQRFTVGDMADATFDAYQAAIEARRRRTPSAWQAPATRASA